MAKTLGRSCKIALSGFVILFCLATMAQGQILFTESFSVILDTSKKVKGSIIPDLKFQTQKKNLFEFQNLADISFRLGKNALTFANKVELSRFGSETFLSGGYVYSEYRRIYDSKLTSETYAQVQWAEARGLELKYAAGSNARYRIHTTEKMGIYVAIGPFYEFERWNYKGVADETKIPPNPQSIENKVVKIGSYISFKRQLSDKLFFDCSIYHQNRPDRYFKLPRLASSSRATYKISEHLGLSMMYQNIYDYNPIVPINNAFHRVITSVNISF